MRFLQALLRALDRPLVAAVLAFDRARDVDAAQFLKRVVEDAVPEDVVPRVGEKPEARRHVRAHRGALRPRRALARAALHFGAHRVVHPVEGNVTDSLFGHVASVNKQC